MYLMEICWNIYISVVCRDNACEWRIPAICRGSNKYYSTLFYSVIQLVPLYRVLVVNNKHKVNDALWEQRIYFRVAPKLYVVVSAQGRRQLIPSCFF